jgi:hypothetical protein
MDSSIYVVFEDPAAANQARRTLAETAGIPEPSQEEVVTGALRQDHVHWHDSRARTGAALGAAMTALVGAMVLGLAGAGGVLPISVPTAILTGAVGGGIYGFVLGAIAGSTEPKPKLERVRALVRRGRVAFMAKFEDPAAAQRAQDVLLRCPGAKGTV